MPDSVLHKSNKIAVVQPTNMTKVCVIYSRWKNFDLFKFLKPCPTWLMVADSVQDSFSNSKSADDPISVGLWYRLPQWSLLIFAFSYSSWSSQGKNVQVACHSLLQWTTFCQNCPPWPVRLGWPYTAWLSFTELDKAVVHVIGLASFLWLWFRLSALWCPLSALLSVSASFLNVSFLGHW